MVTQKRMSPLTAFVLGVAGVAAVAIASGSAVVVYGMRVAGGNAEAIVKFAENTVAGLPELIDALPPALGDILNDRRAPAYVRDIDVEVSFVANQDGDRYRPVLTVTNTGDEVVSMLAIRVAALREGRVPLAEWTELAATPISLEDENWRGPLMPGASRHMVVGRWRSIEPSALASIEPAFEISDVRIWRSEANASPVTAVASATD